MNPFLHAMSVSRLARRPKSSRHGFQRARLEAIPNFLHSYLEQKKLAGFSLLVARHGEVALRVHRGRSAFAEHGGFALDERTIFRIYSMTKPITSIGLMMLYEQGKFKLGDELAKFLPAFGDVRVFRKGTPRAYETCKPKRAITVHDLLTHQSGLTYDFMATHAVDALYRNQKLVSGRRDETLAEFCARAAKMPLLFSPGERWNYSIATDVCGHLIELISGQSLDAYFAEQIFAPLGMRDTSFTIPEEKRARLAHNYQRDPLTKAIRLVDSPERTIYAPGRKNLSGGGGLLSTLEDYYRFCQMLLQRGRIGERADGERLVSRKTIDLMTCNHLPGNATLEERGDTAFTESGMTGIGFGLGFSINLGPAQTGNIGSPGIFSWGGMASTYFWIDPQEELIVIFMTQLMPSDAYPVRAQLQQLIYGAFND